MQNTRTLVRIALFAALIAVLSQISIPMPSGVPITLQTFAVALAGYALGAKRGAACVGVYIALGAVGAPVFAGFTGGFAKLFGVTGGFLWGFVLMAALCGLGTLCKKTAAAVGIGALGLLACHLCGVLQFMFVAQVDFAKAALTVSVPYLAKDFLSVAVGWMAACAVTRALSRAAV